MTTRADIRTRTRDELNDNGMVKLWSDTLLNRWIGEAIREWSRVVPRDRTWQTTSAANDPSYVLPGDVLEVVTLVGGGAPETPEPPPLAIGPHRFRSRLLVGTGKYTTLELMRDCLDASGCEVVTVAVRRERLFDREGRSLLDFLDPARYMILPNTAGCFNADEARAKLKGAQLEVRAACGRGPLKNRQGTEPRCCSSCTYR